MSIVKARIFEPKYNSNKCFHYIYNKNNENLIFTQEEYKQYKQLVTSILNQSDDIKLNGKVYLGKLSSLPRFKIKDYFKENKINKTSKIEQSDIIILNRKHLIEFNNILDPSDISYYNKLYSCKIYKFNSKKDKEFINQYNNNNYGYYDNNIDFILKINDDYTNSLPSNVINFLKDKTYENVLYKQIYREKNIIELYTYLDYILKNPHVNIIFDDNLMNSLNKNGFELDDDYLSTLDDMFNSKSQDNINLALEMLSNVNIEKYLLIIALFLNKHKNKFSWGSGLSINNNSSFKSTLKYLESKNIIWNNDWRCFSTNLYKLYQNNPENIAIIRNFI